MFDYFHDGGSVKTFQPLIPVHQRALNQLHPFLLLRRHSFQTEPRGSQLKTPVRNVHPKNVCSNCLSLEQLPDELSFAAAEVENSLGTMCLQFGDNLLQAGIVQPERGFDGLLLLFLRFLLRIGID